MTGRGEHTVQEAARSSSDHMENESSELSIGSSWRRLLSSASQYLVELDDVQIGIPDEADLAASVAIDRRTFGDPDAFLI